MNEGCYNKICQSRSHNLSGGGANLTNLRERTFDEKLPNPNVCLPSQFFMSEHSTWKMSAWMHSLFVKDVWLQLRVPGFASFHYLLVREVLTYDDGILTTIRKFVCHSPTVECTAIKIISQHNNSANKFVRVHVILRHKLCKNILISRIQLSVKNCFRMREYCFRVHKSMCIWQSTNERAESSSCL